MQEITDGSAKFRVVDKRLKAMIDILYPVGIVVTTATDDALKPGEEDGLAQWEEIAQDKVLQGAVSGAGGTIEAGLPNIKGYAKLGVWEEETGPFYREGEVKTANMSNEKAPLLNFDASKSNNIYGNSSTVQPPAYKVHFWKRIK